MQRIMNVSVLSSDRRLTSGSFSSRRLYLACRPDLYQHDQHCSKAIHLIWQSMKNYWLLPWLKHVVERCRSSRITASETRIKSWKLDSYIYLHGILHRKSQTFAPSFLSEKKGSSMTTKLQEVIWYFSQVPVREWPKGIMQQIHVHPRYQAPTSAERLSCTEFADNILPACHVIHC